MSMRIATRPEVRKSGSPEVFPLVDLADPIDASLCICACGLPDFRLVREKAGLPD
jgi:hypothetical protein